MGPIEWIALAGVVVSAGTLAFLVIDRFKGGVKDDVKMADELSGLSRAVKELSEKIASMAGDAATRNQAQDRMGYKIAQAEEVLREYRALSDAFIRAQAVNEASHAQHKEDMARVEEGLKNVATQVRNIALGEQNRSRLLGELGEPTRMRAPGDHAA